MNSQDIDIILKEAYPLLSDKWDNDIIPKLKEFIRIPNKSSAFDSDWKLNGYMNDAMQLIIDWCKQQNIKNMELNLYEDPGKTPLLFLEIPGDIDDTILLYGHMDKQPEMKGWDEDKGPWQPVLKDGKLYGRGGADDGYAVFASLAAIQLLQENHIPHARCVIIIEASEESGSCDLPHYLEKLSEKIGDPNLVICLDSGCGNYEQLWSSTSLRGLIEGVLEINVIKSGIHSGAGSGVVPSTFNILRQLLDRVDNSATDEVLLDALKVNIPSQRIEQAKKTADLLGDEFFTSYDFIENTKPLTQNITQLMLNKTWRAAVSVVGSDGLPSTEKGGNVTLPSLSVKLSIRIPPTCDHADAVEALQSTLEKNPPHEAQVKFTPGFCASGWNAPKLATWLVHANDKASHLFFNRPAAYLGEGGSIPFMGMLGKMHPNAQFLIAGVLGPQSNAHGPNEFLHINMAKSLTACIASVIASHYQEFSV